ncbi:MAG: hypothetical protein ACPGSK_07700, partial [Alphaproteobacteria bacterium]
LTPPSHTSLSHTAGRASLRRAAQVQERVVKLLGRVLLLASGPASVLNSDQMLEVFGRGADKGVWHKRQYTNVNGSVSWTRCAGKSAMPRPWMTWPIWLAKPEAKSISTNSGV